MPKKVENFKCAFDCLSDTHIASDQCIACQRRAFSNHNSMQFSTLSISVHWFSFIFCVLILQINFQWKKCFEGEKKRFSTASAVGSIVWLLAGFWLCILQVDKIAIIFSMDRIPWLNIGTVELPQGNTIPRKSDGVGCIWGQY